MDRAKLKRVLELVREGALSSDDAIGALKGLPFEDLGFVKLDLHRALRRGFPETVYCPGKQPAQLREIAWKLGEHHDTVLFTKADRVAFAAIRDALPEAEFFAEARIVRMMRHKPTPVGRVLVLSAGTIDIPVAEEAIITAETMGSAVVRRYDVGTAGLPRLLALRGEIDAARVIVVVAGMDGALPSVVAGLAEAPVVAVPTSGGYGAGFEGLAALLTMLNACAPGVGVVNIDNGYGAGYLAAVINRMAVGQTA